MKNIIVGTAGHIDHGKTALVKALTGIDADRLKEEKQRGITIDIGFADLAVGDCRFGFVDVPGHERFVKNMLAGAHGLDLVMLVVAADESVMPQTREHFDICRLLRVKSGLIALTKSDLVEPDLLELARAEVEEFVAGSFLEGAPIVPVSSRTGEGIESLKTALVDLAARVEPKTTAAIMRLPVDRAFSIRGFGTVVTGTLIAGEITVGDELDVLPSGPRARVRNVQVHGHDTGKAIAGQRTAINLQGVNVDQVERGSTLAPAGKLHTTSILDARLDLLPGAPRPLNHRARVRLHHGTAEVMARVALLGRQQSEGAPRINPGENAVVQLRLERPITALPGDRFIIRSYSPQVTIGGGVILDALPRKHRVRDLEAAARVEQLENADAEGKLDSFIAMSGPRGLDADEIVARTGATGKQIDALAKSLVSTGRVVEVSTNPLVLISAEAQKALGAQVVNLLGDRHRRDPLSLGLSREEVRERIFSHARPEVFRSIVRGLVDDGKLAAERDTLRLASHRPEMSGVEAEARRRMEAAIEAAGLQAPTLEEIAASTGTSIQLARKLFTLLLAEGRVLRIGDFVFAAGALEDLKARVRARRQVGPRMDVAVFKQITGGLSRKYAIPLLEYLDREGLTRRIGNEREIL